MNHLAALSSASRIHWLSETPALSAARRHRSHCFSPTRIVRAIIGSSPIGLAPAPGRAPPRLAFFFAMIVYCRFQNTGV